MSETPDIETDPKHDVILTKLDQIQRVLERLEDRVSAIETGMLDGMHSQQRS